VELITIKVIAAVAIAGLAIRVFIWEAGSIAEGIQQFRHRLRASRRRQNSKGARTGSNV
jgi:hypothetical protein